VNHVANHAANQMIDPFAQQQSFQQHPAPMQGAPMHGAPASNFGTQGMMPMQGTMQQGTMQGQMPMQGQYNNGHHNPQWASPQGQNVGRPASAPPQPHYMPLEAMQGMQNPHVPPHSQGAAPNMPIPSAASTLHQQGGYYPPQHNPHRGFY